MTIKEFNQFIECNKEKLFNFAEANTIYDNQGRVTLAKDDNWRVDYIWDRGDENDSITSNC